MQKQIKNKREGKCKNCSNTRKKADWIKKTIQGNKVFVCNQCGYFNSEGIFKEYKDIKTKQLIFGQPIKGKK